MNTFSNCLLVWTIVLWYGTLCDSDKFTITHQLHFMPSLITTLTRISDFIVLSVKDRSCSAEILDEPYTERKRDCHATRSLKHCTPASQEKMKDSLFLFLIFFLISLTIKRTCE